MGPPGTSCSGAGCTVLGWCGSDGGRTGGPTKGWNRSPTHQVGAWCVESSPSTWWFCLDLLPGRLDVDGIPDPGPAHRLGPAPAVTLAILLAIAVGIGAQYVPRPRRPAPGGLLPLGAGCSGFGACRRPGGHRLSGQRGCRRIHLLPVLRPCDRADHPNPNSPPGSRRLRPGDDVVALGVALLLNATLLEQGARAQPPSWTRSLSLAIIEPIAGVARFLGLDQPREAINSALGRETSTPPSEEAVTATPSTTTTATRKDRTPDHRHRAQVDNRPGHHHARCRRRFAHPHRRSACSRYG